jgi:hypothetical protein
MAQRALQSLEKAVANEIRKFAYRTEFDRPRKLVTATRAGALGGLRAHGPKCPSAAA